MGKDKKDKKDKGLIIYECATKFGPANESENFVAEVQKTLGYENKPTLETLTRTLFNYCMEHKLVIPFFPALMIAGKKRNPTWNNKGLVISINYLPEDLKKKALEEKTSYSIKVEKDLTVVLTPIRE